MTVTICIYALLSPNPPVSQNWGEREGEGKQILAMRKRLLIKLAPKHILSTQRPTVVLWEGRYITPHQLYQVGKYWWSLFQVNTTNINNKCLPAWFYQMNYCRIPNALQCLKSCCSIPNFLLAVLFVCKAEALESLEQSLMKKENRSHTAYYPPSHPAEAGLLYFYSIY